jgi:glycosyltransferase involved in cell wall biosynthesis
MTAVYRLTAFTGADQWYQHIAQLLNAPLFTGKPPQDYDTVICPAMVAGSVKAGRVIACLHRDEPIKAESDAVIYCAEWLQKKYPVGVPSMVFRPVNRLEPLKDRGYVGHQLGFINLSMSKGGHWANDCGVQVLALDRAVRRSVGNVTVLPYMPDPLPFYNCISYFCLPSRSEGYSTVCLEALSQSLPIIATDIPGIREVCGDAAYYISDKSQIKTAVKEIGANYAQWSAAAWDRWEKIKGLNDIEHLITFTT